MTHCPLSLSSLSPLICMHARAQALSKDRGEAAIEGEVYKWLGHCWGKLGDAKKSESYFMEGAEFGKDKGQVKVRV